MNKKAKGGIWIAIIVMVVLAAAFVALIKFVPGVSQSFATADCVREPVTFNGQTFSSIAAAQSATGLSDAQMTTIIATYDVQVENGVVTWCAPPPMEGSS